MEHLSFILWICLYPVATSVESYLNALRRKIANDEQLTEDKRIGYNLLIGVFYIWIAVELW